MNFHKLLSSYDYKLPIQLIAQSPAQPRDNARLLIYRKRDKKIGFDTFSNIGKYPPKNSVLVFNQTKVVPARLMVKKQTGGRAELLYIDHDGHGLIKVMADRKLQMASRLFLKSTISFKVIKQKENFYYLKPSFPISKLQSLISKYGQTPLPPYIKNSPLTEKQRREQYQSVFAKSGLSVAAPTASLHFTKKLITQLKQQGIEVKFVTLNVNLGTFAPLQENNLKSGRLHAETYGIDQKTAADINQAKRKGKTIIAVGTTVVRTLESAAQQGKLTSLSGNTRLFIRPPYRFKFVDGLITNFHVPKSSLLMLASALIGRKKLLDLYHLAIKKRLRFFSFGDGMLILP